MDTTENLQLPFLQAGQAQKHVTHNDALVALDAMLHISVATSSLNLPPPSPANGERCIVGAAPSGAFSGHAGSVAAWQGQGWSFHTPRRGWLAHATDADMLLVFDGSNWIPVRTRVPQSLPMLGIAATPDAANRLAVKSPTVLFDHDGAGSQVKLNKASSAATGSLLFQTGYSGRAEIGLTGDDRLHLKVSQDGAGWAEGVTLGISAGQLATGIGTAEPARTFHVKTTFGEFLFEDVAQPAEMRRFNIFLYDSGTAFRALNAAGDGGAIWLYAKHGSGEVGLGTLSPTAGFRLDVAGSVRCSSLTQTSDATAKTVLGPAPGLEFIRLLSPVAYRWKGTPASRGRYSGAEGGAVGEAIELRAAQAAGKRSHFGLIAQEVKRAADSLGLDFGGYKNTAIADPDRPAEHLLDYAQFIAPLVRAVQELSERLERLEETSAAVSAGAGS